MSSIFKILNLKSTIIFLFLCGEIFSQNIEGVNARLDAMGGSAAADDIGWTIGHPASIYKFPNHFQGNVCLMPIPGIDRTYGTAIGIVRFTDFLYAGVTLNNRLKMPRSFYSEGALFINARHLDDEGRLKGFPHIPQVNLCLKLNNNLQFGVGGYFESGIYEYKAKKMRQYTTTTGIDTIFYEEIHDNKRVRNIGFNIESRITFGSLTIYPQLVVGFPEIKGFESYDVLDGAKQYFNNATAVDTFSNLRMIYSSSQGLFLRGGSYFWGEIGNTFWKTGVIYTNKRYQFKKNTDLLTQTLNIDGTVDSTFVDTLYDFIPSDHKWQFIDFFLAFAPSFSDNLFFSPEYNGGFGWYKGKDDKATSTDASYDPSDTTFLFTYHNIRLGIEKTKESFWFFDEIAFRCGIQAQWNKEWRYIDNFDDVSTSEESIPWKSFFWGSDFTKKEAKISGGFGLKKGRGSFDVSCDWLKWQGQSTLTGPSAAMATLTVDFSRKKDF